MIVGHRISVGGNEEAGTLAGDHVAAAGAALIALIARAALTVVGRPELTEEAIHRGSPAEGQIALESHRSRAAIHLDANRDDGGLHLVDDIGESDRPLQALGMRHRAAEA